MGPGSPRSRATSSASAVAPSRHASKAPKWASCSGQGGVGRDQRGHHSPGSSAEVGPLTAIASGTGAQPTPQETTVRKAPPDSAARGTTKGVRDRRPRETSTLSGTGVGTGDHTPCHAGASGAGAGTSGADKATLSAAPRRVSAPPRWSRTAARERRRAQARRPSARTLCSRRSRAVFVRRARGPAAPPRPSAPRPCRRTPPGSAMAKAGGRGLRPPATARKTRVP
jgi:hypothetical protein